jgi:hypothetical protein
MQLGHKLAEVQSEYSKNKIARKYACTIEMQQSIRKVKYHCAVPLQHQLDMLAIPTEFFINRSLWRVIKVGHSDANCGYIV